jgi:hypothetical protein
MVIGKTDFISELYAGYIVEEYEKNMILMYLIKIKKIMLRELFI